MWSWTTAEMIRLCYTIALEKNIRGETTLVQVSCVCFYPGVAISLMQ